MNDIVALAIGGLYAAGLFLLLGRSYVRVALGVAVLGQGTFLLVFAMGRLTRAHAPLVAEGAALPPEPFMDPVPQALVLTAIVIGFAVQAFTLVLLRQAYRATQEPDLDRLTSSEADT